MGYLAGSILQFKTINAENELLIYKVQQLWDQSELIGLSSRAQQLTAALRRSKHYNQALYGQ